MYILDVLLDPRSIIVAVSPDMPSRIAVEFSHDKFSRTLQSTDVSHAQVVIQPWSGS